MYKPEVLCFSEYFLSMSELEAFKMVGFSKITGFCRNTPHTRRGGVCILVADSLKFNAVYTFCIEDFCELAAIRLVVNGASYFILAVYRLPINNTTDIDAFISCVDMCFRRN